MKKYLKYSPEELWNNRYDDMELLEQWDNLEFWEAIIKNSFGDVLANKDKKMSLKDYYLELNKENYKLLKIVIDKKSDHNVLIHGKMSLNDIDDLVNPIINLDLNNYNKRLTIGDKCSLSFTNKKTEPVKKVESEKKVTNEKEFTQSFDKIMINPEKIKSEFPDIDIDNLNYTTEEIYAILLVSKDPKKDFELGAKVDLIINQSDPNKRGPLKEEAIPNFGYVHSVTTNAKGRPTKCTIYEFDPSCEPDKRKTEFIWHGSPSKGRWIAKEEHDEINGGKVIIKKLKIIGLQVNPEPWTPTF